jgi:cyclopropane-fatty-acyl-phospholipid synthase
MPSYLTQPLTCGGDLIRSTLGSVSWGPALSVSKAAVTSLFSRIENGTLVVIDETTGRTASYGQKIAKEHSKMANGVNGTSKKRNGAGTV